jgi:hypothetical protein
MVSQQFTPGPWIDEETGEWLHDPRELLTSTANAALMGSAPDLYAACEALMESAEDEGGGDDGGEVAAGLFWAAVRLARAALAKIETEGTNA